ESVRQKIEFFWQEIRLGNLLCLHQFGTLPADLTRANMERFARDVMPTLRAITGAEAAAAR
ncbi:MAG: hypothetical protein RLT05_23020, partial [Bauldia litoralis]